MATSKTLTATNVTMSIPEMTDAPNASVFSTDVGALGDAANKNTATGAALGSSIAIISDGDTHVALSAGDYVYIKNHGTLSEGLYTANEGIAANYGLTSSNVTAVSGGGLNSLNNNIANLESLFSRTGTATALTAITGRNSTFDILQNSMYCSYDDNCVCVWGSIRLINFVRTGGNPGINIALPVSVQTSSSGYGQAIVTTNPSGEISQIEVFSHSFEVYSSESYANYTSSGFIAYIPFLVIKRA